MNEELFLVSDGSYGLYISKNYVVTRSEVEEAVIRLKNSGVEYPVINKLYDPIEVFESTK